MDRFIKTDTEYVGAEALPAYGAHPPKRFKTLQFEGARPGGGHRGNQGRRRGGRP